MAAATSVGRPQSIDGLGEGVGLQRVLAGLQQQRQGLAGGAQAAEQAAEQQRCGEMPGLFDGTASTQAAHPLACLAGTSLGLQLPFMTLHGGMPAVGALGASEALAPGAQPICIGRPLPTSQTAPSSGMLPPSHPHALGGAANGGNAALPAQLPLHLSQQHPGGAGSSSHSHSGADSADGGSGERRVRGGAARRTSEERLHATKEKNRRAQQRFRLRQKEKMVWLEAELQRLQALCSRNGIDPAPPLPPPAALRGPPRPTTAPPMPQAQGGAQAVQNLPEAAAAPGPDLQAATQAAAVLLGAAQQAAGVQPGSKTQPSTEQMYEQLEAMLERCPLVPSETAIAFLTAFQRTSEETRRCQYHSLRRRFDASRAHEVASCVKHFLAAAAGGAGAGAPGAAAVAAGVHKAPQEQPNAASEAPSPEVA